MFAISITVGVVLGFLYLRLFALSNKATKDRLPQWVNYIYAIAYVFIPAIVAAIGSKLDKDISYGFVVFALVGLFGASIYPGLNKVFHRISTGRSDR